MKVDRTDARCAGGVAGWWRWFYRRQVVQVAVKDRRRTQGHHEAVVPSQLSHRVSQTGSEWRHQRLQQQVRRAVEVGQFIFILILCLSLSDVFLADKF